MTLYEAISKAMLTILTYCLQRTPAADEIGPTAQGYADALMRQGYTDLDAERAMEAIMYLGGNSNDWPTPYQVVLRMREEARLRLLKPAQLVQLPPTPERREQLRKLLAEARANLTRPP